MLRQCTYFFIKIKFSDPNFNDINNYQGTGKKLGIEGEKNLFVT